MVKGMKIQGYLEDKAELLAAWEVHRKTGVSEVFRAVGETLGIVFKPRMGTL